PSFRSGREAAPETLEGGHAVVLVELQCRLQVRAGAEPVLPQPLTDAAVVVDLAVADEPDLLLAAGKRLRAGAGVGDAEVPGAEPALTRPHRGGTVGPAVRHPLEHALPEGVVEGSMGRHNCRHGRHLTRRS